MTTAVPGAAPTLGAAAVVAPARPHRRKAKNERPNRKEPPCRGS